VIKALIHALGFLFRTPRGQRGFKTIVVLTLAATITGVTCVFSLLDGLLFRPLVGISDDGVVNIFEYPGARGPRFASPVSWGCYVALRDRCTAFVRSGTFRLRNFEVRLQESSELVYAASVGGDLMSLLAVKPFLGAVISGVQPSGDNAPTLMLSHDFWQQKFDGDRAVLGRELALDGRMYRIIGVLPPDFEIPGTVSNSAPSLYAQELSSEVSELPMRGGAGYTVVAHLKPGVSSAQASAEVSRVGTRLAAEFPKTNTGVAYTAVPLRERMLGPFYFQLWGVFVASLLLLVLGCCNAANLILARWVQAEQELAIRVAIGASACRVMARIVLENAWLVLLATVLALVASYGVAPAVEALLPNSSLRAAFDLAPIDLRIFAFVGCVAGLVCVGVSIFPSYHALTLKIDESLRAGSSKTIGGKRGKYAGAVLVTAQVTISTALLIANFLILQSTRNAERERMGMADDSVLTTRLGLRANDYPDRTARRSAIQQLLTEFARLPGVLSAASISSNVPWPEQNTTRFQKANDTGPFEATSNHAAELVVSRDFAETLGVRTISGRIFNSGDRFDSTRVVVISAELAKRYWKGANPIGETLRFKKGGDGIVERKIIGIVTDLKAAGPRPEPLPVVFELMDQQPPYLTSMMIRTNGISPLSLRRDIERLVSAQNPGNAIYQFVTLGEYYRNSRWQAELIKSLLSVFAALALALAVTGVYAVLTYTVSQRMPEFALRLALGSTPGGIAFLVTRRGLILVSIGLVFGLVLAASGTSFLRAILYGVSPFEPSTFIEVAGLLLGSAFVACSAPAWRATRADPAASLRS
jgi:putative ABC transport system permease protein